MLNKTVSEFNGCQSTNFSSVFHSSEKSPTKVGTLTPLLKNEINQEAAASLLHQLEHRRRHCFDSGAQSWFRQRLEQAGMQGRERLA